LLAFSFYYAKLQNMVKNKATAKETKTVKRQVIPNPTGKGGLGENPQNIDTGGTEADMTYAYLIKKAGEHDSKRDKEKTKKIAAIEKQWEKAEDGELPSVNWLADREEGKPKQSTDVTSGGKTIQVFSKVPDMVGLESD